MDNLSMSFRLKNIVFEKDYLKLTDSKEGKYQISYEELVFVYLEAYSAESGEKRHCRWKLKTDLSGKKAGAIMIELGIHAPYILLGSQAWLDENEEDDFDQAKKMVQIMRKCESAT